MEADYKYNWADSTRLFIFENQSSVAFPAMQHYPYFQEAGVNDSSWRIYLQHLLPGGLKSGVDLAVVFYSWPYHLFGRIVKQFRQS